MPLNDRRRAHPSIVIPLIYFFLEAAVMWLVLSLFNTTFNPLEWVPATYVIALLWVIFIAMKLFWVLRRQKSQQHD